MIGKEIKKQTEGSHEAHCSLEKYVPAAQFMHTGSSRSKLSDAQLSQLLADCEHDSQLDAHAKHVPFDANVPSGQ